MLKIEQVSWVLLTISQIYFHAGPTEDKVENKASLEGEMVDKLEDILVETGDSVPWWLQQVKRALVLVLVCELALEIHLSTGSSPLYWSSNRTNQCGTVHYSWVGEAAYSLHGGKSIKTPSPKWKKSIKNNKTVDRTNYLKMMTF